MKKVILGLSGGMDSTTLCGYYIDKGYDVCPISFEYGSKHNPYENKSAKMVADFYGLKITNIPLDFIKTLFQSNLLKTGGDIPEGHYAQDNMKLTVVPGRNIIFLSIMSGLAWSLEADTIALGVHMGDHTIYEDCRAGFISAMNSAIIQGTGERVKIEAPFQYLDKTGILKIGNSLEIPVPYHLTRTCYKDQEFSCGCCGSCSERLEAFENIGIVDPIKYEAK